MSPEPSARDVTRSTRVARNYDQAAAAYDANHLAGVQKYARIEKSMRKLLTRGRVLDLGCGTGRLSALGYPAEIWGIDLSHQMLREAQRHSARLVRADGHRLPFGDACFDAVIAAQGVIRYMNLPAAFAEIARVLKPGGRCAVHQFGNAFSFRGLLGERSAPNPLSLDSVDQLITPARACGLVLERSELWRSTSGIYPHAVRIPPKLPWQLWNHCMIFLTRPKDP